MCCKKKPNNLFINSSLAADFKIILIHWFLITLCNIIYLALDYIIKIKLQVVFFTNFKLKFLAY